MIEKKMLEFIWSDECQKALELIRQKLIEKPILKYPFTLTTDASGNGIGAVLSQEYDEKYLQSKICREP